MGSDLHTFMLWLQLHLIVDRAYAKQGMRGGTEPSASDADAQD